MTSVGRRLSYTRNSILKMNQKDFSHLIGVSQGALSEMEHDKRGLSMEAIIELMKYSKTDNRISCSWILTGLEDEQKHHTEPTLSADQLELVNTYNKLDRRGQHRVHTIIYEELDRMNGTTVPLSQVQGA